MFLAPSLVLLCCVPAADPPADAAKELMKLKGSWKLIGGEEVGRPITPEDAQKEVEVFTFTGDKLVIRRNGKLLLELAVRPTPGKSFGAIDFKHTSGQYDGKTCHAIYALDGDELKICTASKMRSDEPADRPTVFSTKKSEKPGEKVGTLLFVLKREKQ
jgi:uncharacterized protein (TIGR03067 family)